VQVLEKRFAWEGGALLALFCATGAAAQDSRYLELGRRYAAGDRAVAVAELGDFTAARLARELESLHTLMAPSSGTGRPAPGEAPTAAPPLRALVMLHVDRDAFERRPSPVSEQAPVCGTDVHLAYAERVATLLFAEAEGREFARRFYLAVMLREFGYTCFADAQRRVEAGLRWFPKDPDLLMARGSLAEATASLGPRDPAPLKRQGAERARAIERLQGQSLALEEAARSYEQALAVKTDLDEARLRLGRVRLRQGRLEAAQRSLEGVRDQSDDPDLVYLADLFLGRLHEGRGRLAEAQQEYTEALTLRPQAQSGAIALSHVQSLLGQGNAARATLEAALALSGVRSEMDPYWDYLLARSGSRSAALLDELRKEASR
jgi:tetratricopeptide (TPR) repeat protein